MSIYIPEINITSKQFITNAANEKLELRLHGNKLYVMNTTGNGFEGGELVLDPLPDSILYGAGGDSLNEAIDAKMTFTGLDSAGFVATERAVFMSTMNEETGGSTVVNSVGEGSAVVDFTVFFDSFKSSGDIDALVVSLGDATQITAMFAGKSAALQTAARTNGSTPTRSLKKAAAAITSVTGATNDGVSTLVIGTVGGYNQLSYQLDAGAWVTLAVGAPSSTVFTPPSNVFTVIAKLISPEGLLLGSELSRQITMSVYSNFMDAAWSDYFMPFDVDPSPTAWGWSNWSWVSAETQYVDGVVKVWTTTGAGASYANGSGSTAGNQSWTIQMDYKFTGGTGIVWSNDLKMGGHVMFYYDITANSFGFTDWDKSQSYYSVPLPGGIDMSDGNWHTVTITKKYAWSGFSVYVDQTNVWHGDHFAYAINAWDGSNSDVIGIDGNTLPVYNQTYGEAENHISNQCVMYTRNWGRMTTIGYSLAELQALTLENPF